MARVQRAACSGLESRGRAPCGLHRMALLARGGTGERTDAPRGRAGARCTARGHLPELARKRRITAACAPRRPNGGPVPCDARRGAAASRTPAFAGQAREQALPGLAGAARHAGAPVHRWENFSARGAPRPLGRTTGRPAGRSRSPARLAAAGEVVARTPGGSHRPRPARGAGLQLRWVEASDSDRRRATSPAGARAELAGPRAQQRRDAVQCPATGPAGAGSAAWEGGRRDKRRNGGWPFFRWGGLSNATAHRTSTAGWCWPRCGALPSPATVPCAGACSPGPR